MKKFLTFAIVLILLAGVLAGCNPPQEENKPTSYIDEVSLSTTSENDTSQCVFKIPEEPTDLSHLQITEFSSSFIDGIEFNVTAEEVLERLWELGKEVNGPIDCWKEAANDPQLPCPCPDNSAIGEETQLWGSFET